MTISGSVYRLAAANTLGTPISLGNVHVGGTFGTAGPEHQQHGDRRRLQRGLDAAFGSVTGAASDNGGSISLLARGRTQQHGHDGGPGSGTQGTAGPISGTVLVNLTRDGSGTSGLGTTGLSGQTVTISGTVYRLAAANTISTPISLGNVHVGGTFGTQALSIQQHGDRRRLQRGLGRGLRQRDRRGQQQQRLD